MFDSRPVVFKPHYVPTMPRKGGIVGTDIDRCIMLNTPYACMNY